MLIPGTQMHIVTFIFVSIEIVILFYLIIYRLARPDDKTAYLNIILIFLLITYNITGGLLPDTKLPGSFFIQMSIAYATGFITPCYFPYYVHKAFGLEKMRFHAYKGVYLFLVLPYAIFVVVFAITNNLDTAKNLLAIAVVYAVWVIYSLVKAIRNKYKNTFASSDSKEEIITLFLSIASWVGVPVIDYFNLGQAIEASITNFGFLLLFSLQVKRHIKQSRTEHQRLIDSEQRLLNWNTNLQAEVDKRTQQLEAINEQRTNTFINLAHETKTPITLIKNYMEDYINSHEQSDELLIVKRSIDKMSADIINLFDVEKFNKGFTVYNHEQIADFSNILSESIFLFNHYAANCNISIVATIEKNILVKADPLSLSRVINNLIENAIKYSVANNNIEVILKESENRILFTVKDFGEGILPTLHRKIFEPYFQIAKQKNNTQGMGLGLPIVKIVLDDMGGHIKIKSNPQLSKGTEIIITLEKYIPAPAEFVVTGIKGFSIPNETQKISAEPGTYNLAWQNILLVEDNPDMSRYLSKKLSQSYNVYSASNGNEGIKKLKEMHVIPDLIISDIMMDKLDGYSFAKIISESPQSSHIPLIFLTAKSDAKDRMKGLQLGAVDFIHKPFLTTELLQKINSIITNASKQKRAMLEKMFNGNSLTNSPVKKANEGSFSNNCEMYHLTTRETEIAQLVCKGSSYKSISSELFIAEKTVAKHVQNIFEKVKVSSKLELLNKLGAGLSI